MKFNCFTNIALIFLLNLLLEMTFSFNLNVKRRKTTTKQDFREGFLVRYHDDEAFKGKKEIFKVYQIKIDINKYQNSIASSEEPKSSLKFEILKSFTKSNCFIQANLNIFSDISELPFEKLEMNWFGVKEHFKFLKQLNNYEDVLKEFKTFNKDIFNKEIKTDNFNYFSFNFERVLEVESVQSMITVRHFDVILIFEDSGKKTDEKFFEFLKSFYGIERKKIESAR